MHMSTSPATQDTTDTDTRARVRALGAPRKGEGENAVKGTPR